MPQTPGLRRHTSRKTTLTLCIDNFGIQYFSKADTDHLIDAIQYTYECSINWKHQELLSGNSCEVLPIHAHPQKSIPQEVLDEYDIIFDDRDFTHAEIRRGMYGLKESGVIAFD